MIIFFHGADGWRSREKVRELIAGYKTKNPDNTGLFRFDFEDESAGDERGALRRLEESLASGGLFAAKKFLIVRQVFVPEKKRAHGEEKKPATRSKTGGTEGAKEVTGREGEFLALLERHPDIADKDSPVILLVWETKAIKKTNALARSLEQHAGLQQEFTPLDERHLEHWVLEYLKHQAPGTTITREALRRLLMETGPDLFRLEAELLKLSNFVGEGVITSGTLEQLVSEERLEVRVFDAFNALAIGDTKTALSLLEQAAINTDETLKILGLCAWQLRMIAALSDAYYTQGAHTESALAQATGYKPFQIGKILRNMGKYTPKEMQRRFDLLAELDAQAKGKDGGLDPHLALSLFVMKF